MVVSTLLPQPVVFAAVVVAPVSVPSAQAAFATVLWATTVPTQPLRIVVRVVLLLKQLAELQRPTHRLLPVVAVAASEVVASAVAVAVPQVEAVAAVDAQPVAMQAAVVESE